MNENIKTYQKLLGVVRALITVLVSKKLHVRWLVNGQI